MLDWLAEQRALLLWLFVGSLASLVLVMALLPVVVVRLPADHFVRDRAATAARRGPLQWLWHVVKNVLGAAFVLAGIAMLVLPGQGVLTILIGLLLLDIPGKRGVERRILGRPKILAFVNRMRGRHGRPPLLVEPPAPPDAAAR